MKTQKRMYIGPYRVRDIGANGSVYEVVEMEDNHSTARQSLRPPYTTLSRAVAHGKCARLNKRWSTQLNPDEMDLLDYWKEATN